MNDNETYRTEIRDARLFFGPSEERQTLINALFYELVMSRPPIIQSTRKGVILTNRLNQSVPMAVETLYAVKLCRFELAGGFVTVLYRSRTSTRGQAERSPGESESSGDTWKRVSARFFKPDSRSCGLVTTNVDDCRVWYGRPSDRKERVHVQKAQSKCM